MPCWHVSRFRLLDGLRRAAGAGAIALPTKDLGQREVLQELRREMEGIAERPWRPKQTQGLPSFGHAINAF